MSRSRRDTRPTNYAAASAAQPVFEISEEHQRLVNHTKSFQKKVKTMQDQRARINQIIKFIREKYPQYYRTTVILLTPEIIATPNRNYFKATHDLVYSNLSIDIILAFMGEKKNKGGGKIMSHVHIRKYHDALMFGAKEVGHGFSQEYYQQMDTFLDNYRKEVAEAKTKGNIDEEEADPISFDLYQMIAFWFLCSGNIFAWFFLLCCWNFMARTINVDNFSFRNLTSGTDSIKVKYFRTKADQDGKKCQHKNIYANPFNPRVCFFTGMGIYCAVNASILGTRFTFFLKINTLAGTASSSFCRFLTALTKQYKVVVAEHVRMEHCNAHGIRKGSGTHSTSCTTCPPSLVAVALRGDWSMGKIFDTYFTFGEFGDQYLGKSCPVLSCPVLLCYICHNLTHCFLLRTHPSRAEPFQTMFCIPASSFYRRNE